MPAAGAPGTSGASVEGEMARWFVAIGGLCGALLGGCSETGLSQGVDPAFGAQDGGPDGGGEPGDGGDDPGTGGDEPGSGDPGGADPCWEPEDGYRQNPAARLVVTDGTLPITFVWWGSHAGYAQELLLDAPEGVVVGDSELTPVGEEVTVGPYPVGTELILGHHVVDTGDHWQSGPASRNGDGEIHGAARYRGGCSWWFGFEDTAGGGDADYDDLLVRVDGPLRQER